MRNTYGVQYSLADHLKVQLEEFDFDEKFQAAVSLNRVDAHFIDLFFSGKANEVYLKVEELLNNDKIKNGAKQECQTKIAQAKSSEDEAAEKIRSDECQIAFHKIKRYFIDNSDNNDTVYTLNEIKLWMVENYPDDIDSHFFNFFTILQESETFLKGKEAVCDKDFYKKFKAYFKDNNLDTIIKAFLDIVEKTST